MLKYWSNLWPAIDGCRWCYLEQSIPIVSYCILLFFLIGCYHLSLRFQRHCRGSEWLSKAVQPCSTNSTNDVLFVCWSWTLHATMLSTDTHTQRHQASSYTYAQYMYCFACMALLVTRTWTSFYRITLACLFHPFFQVDQPNFWDQVYKVQTERDIYEWYGLGPLLISALSLVSLERIFAWSSSNCPKQIQDKWSEKQPRAKE
jgi:hypothetical protein